MPPTRPLTLISWRGDPISDRDIHVIRGTKSIKLLDRITYGEELDEINVSWWFGWDPFPPDVKSVKFTPLFQTDAGTNGGFGVSVDIDTGVVTAGPAAGGLVLHNFLLKCEVTFKAGDVQRVLWVRVHVHDEVKRCWLTPSPLTVFRGEPDPKDDLDPHKWQASAQRFSVLAELATAGEPDPPLVCDISLVPGIKWTSLTTGVTIDAAGKITLTTLGDFKVKAELPTSWGGAEAEGDGIAVLGWHEQPAERRRAWLRAGPGSDRLDEVRNLLLVSEGFTEDQEPIWDEMVMTLIDDLAHSEAFRPIDLFLTNDSLNVWSLFVPSRERGSSALYEIREMPDNPAFGEGIPRARFSDTILDVGWLCATFGLPVRSDAPPASADDQQAAFLKKIDEWKLLRGGAPSPTKRVFDQWLDWAKWSTRTLADERDTALGLAYGARPSFSGDNVDRGAVYHPFRTKRADLDLLLAKVTDGDGPLVGHAWTAANSKDRSLVLAIISGGRAGGIESDRNIASASIHEDGRLLVAKVEATGTSLRRKIMPHDIPRSLLWDRPRIAGFQRGTLVHELAHVFGVGDEYFERENLGQAIPPRSVPYARGWPNLHVPKKDEDLAGDRLPWHWPRIAKAAVLSSPPWKSGSVDWVIPLRAGQKHRFKNGDIVFLRQRPLRRVVAGKLTDAKISPPLVVTSDNQVGDQIVVQVKDGSTIDPADFKTAPGAESILFVPVPPSADAALAGETMAQLVPLVVRNWITQTKLPLDRTATMTCKDLPAENQQHIDPRELVVNAPPTSDPYWVQRQWVGAFDGGARWACGVFHPSPYCMMRTATDTARFCPVCAYVVVDAVDPSLHGEVDKVYAPGYVDPES